MTGEPRLTAGILRALLLGALVFLVMLLLSAVIAFAAFFTSEADVVEVGKVGGVIFFSFHHVGMRTELPTFDPSAVPGAEAAPGGLPLGPIDLSFTIWAALLLGTLLALVLLYRAGRRAAEEGGGSTGAQILQGAFVAVPYAALAALLSLVVRFELDLGPEIASFFGSAGAVEVSAPLLSALLWPLAIAVVAGGLGGYGAARRDVAAATPGRLGAMVSGAWRMLLALLVAGFIGLLILGAVNPDLTASYFETVGSGRSGLVLLLATIAAVPNLALWGITLGMGGSIVAGDLLGADAVRVASLLEFPTDLGLQLAGGSLVGGTPQVSTEVAPIEYFAFIVLTLIALVIGGRMAAQRARVVSAGQGALIGAGSGVLFAIAFFGGLALAGITVNTSVQAGQEGLARMGPGLMLGGLLGLAWGVVAGAIGGATGTGAEAPFPIERRPAPPPAPSGEGPEATQELPPQPATGTGFEGLGARRAPEPEPEPAPAPEPETEPAPEQEARVEEKEASAPPQAPTEPAPGEPPAFEFTSPQAQWRAPEPEPPAEGEPPAGPEEPAGGSAPGPDQEEPTGEQAPPQTPGWTAPKPDAETPSEAPPWSDPADFEPRPWATEEPEPGPAEGSDDEEDEEGPAPA
ncbi:MAG TPA: DUF6350 family protein [Actinomycetota bacterium]